jgi:hypothetical protein
MSVTAETPTRLVPGNTAALDEALAPLVQLVFDPRDCDSALEQILERMTYLSTRGPARDGRVEMLGKMGQTVMMLLLAELKDYSSSGSIDVMKLAEALGTTPETAYRMTEPLS